MMCCADTVQYNQQSVGVAKEHTVYTRNITEKHYKSFFALLLLSSIFFTVLFAHGIYGAIVKLNTFDLFKFYRDILTAYIGSYICESNTIPNIGNLH